MTFSSILSIMYIQGVYTTKARVDMALKDMDETIKKLLNGYAKWCYTILQADRKRIQKQYFANKADLKNAFQEYVATKKAYKFLLEIAKEPKKYLYSGKDLIYADGDLFHKLEPILAVRFDKSQKHLLVRLSEQIAEHVKYGRDDCEGNWIYYEDSNDFAAEAIIEMNKAVQLWNLNNFIAAFKGIAPAYIYAADAYGNASR